MGDHDGEYDHDHDQTLLNLQDRLTSGTGTGVDDLGGDDETLGGMSRQELENEVIRLRGLVQAPSDNDATENTKSVALPSRKRRKKLTPTDDVDAPAREIQAGTGKRVEKDRKTELYKAIRHRVRLHSSPQVTHIRSPG